MAPCASYLYPVDKTDRQRQFSWRESGVQAASSDTLWVAPAGCDSVVGYTGCRVRPVVPSRTRQVRPTRKTTMIDIDGSGGEGGGQVLRSSLGLSLVTGKAFSIRRIRAGRKKPGLLRQHLAAVRAAGEVSRAEVDGDQLGSRELTFTPGDVRPGEYRFAVGSAGSATLVLQAVLPGLMIAEGPSQLVLEGGTHNPFAPPFDFIEKAFLPILERMGPRVTASLDRAGFYPAGGGRISVGIRPEPRLRELDLVERGQVVRCLARGIVSELPLQIAQREVDCIRRKMTLGDDCIETHQVDSPGPGNVVLVEIESRHVTEVFTGFGQKGLPAEKVAARVVREAKRYLKAGVPVGEHLADQLLVPMALVGGRFRTLAPSAHVRTNVETIERFLDVRIQIVEVEPEVYEVVLAPC
jgi:RNA 3'-terminal phosphate cyclase (ATP)